MQGKHESQVNEELLGEALAREALAGGAHDDDALDGGVSAGEAAADGALADRAPTCTVLANKAPISEAEVSEALVAAYEERFGPLSSGAVFAAAPGRVELAGNHTDHQGGKVVSATVGRYVYALVAAQDARVIEVSMEGFGEAVIDLAEPKWNEPRPEERNSSAALVRGMAAQLADAGARVGGCKMVTTSNLPAGAGLSSSAAFEMAIGTAFAALFCEGENAWPTPIHMALASVAAEHSFFGKPCGAQDQITSALGGIVAMDFKDFPPAARTLPFDVSSCGYDICLVDSRCDHSAFTDDFTQITDDMHVVAAVFGKQRLADVDPNRFFARVHSLREEVGDRAVLRAMHFFCEDARVDAQIAALEACDPDAFVRNVARSGASSAQFLQNTCHPTPDGHEQPAAIVSALCSRMLKDGGAYKINGGGFGGGVVAFVPYGQAEAFEAAINESLGYDACLWLELATPGAHTWG